MKCGLPPKPRDEEGNCRKRKGDNPQIIRLFEETEMYDKEV